MSEADADEGCRCRGPAAGYGGITGTKLVDGTSRR